MNLSIDGDFVIDECSDLVLHSKTASMLISIVSGGIEFRLYDNNDTNGVLFRASHGVVAPLENLCAPDVNDDYTAMRYSPLAKSVKVG